MRVRFLDVQFALDSVANDLRDRGQDEAARYVKHAQIATFQEGAITRGDLEAVIRAYADSTRICLLEGPACLLVILGEYVRMNKTSDPAGQVILAGVVPGSALHDLIVAHEGVSITLPAVKESFRTAVRGREIAQEVNHDSE